MKIYNLHFKWTVSRGRDTYGYNICTLLVDGKKKGQCNGGGYDMTGTSFAQWLESEFHNEITELFSKDIQGITASDRQTYTDKKGHEKWYVRKGCAGFYGAHVIQDEKGTRIHLDGACGFDSMKHIAEAIGLNLKWNPESDRYKNHTYYTAVYEPKKKLAA